MDLKTRDKLERIKCPKCDRISTGIRYGQFLWPEWMLRHNAKPYPPHGPRLHSFEEGECWVCAVMRGKKWHR